MFNFLCSIIWGLLGFCGGMYIGEHFFPSIFYSLGILGMILAITLKCVILE